MCSYLRRARVAATAAMLAMIVAACASPPPRGGDTTSDNRLPAVDDTARFARLEAEARALARATGCDAPSSCRTAPVGSRGCGGPRDYVVYCSASTDTAALLGKLEELRRAEAQYNERAGVVSTCEMRMPPSVALQGGRCAASP